MSYSDLTTQFSCSADLPKTVRYTKPAATPKTVIKPQLPAVNRNGLLGHGSVTSGVRHSLTYLLRRVSLDEIGEITTRNFETLFGKKREM